MTAYLNSTGIQQFSITIGAGQTTGTAAINAVGSRAFILFDGNVPNVFGVGVGANVCYSYLTLTNSTTITATRAAVGGSSSTIKGCIVDATSNLINSVQYGTVTIADTTSSGTATITAVTNANTAIHLLGCASSDTQAQYNNSNPILSLSGTTVTASRQGTTAQLIVGFVVIEFQSAALNQSVQNVSASSSSSVTSYTATITSVDVDNSICIYAGSEIATVTKDSSEIKQYGTLTNATTLTAHVNTAVADAKTYNCSVVEFVSGVLNSIVQRGTTTLTAVSSNTSTITSVNVNNSLITWLGTSCSLSGYAPGISDGNAALTNSTTVTVSRSSATSNMVGSWEVAEFASPSSAGVSIGAATVSGVSASKVFSFGFASGSANVSGVVASIIQSSGSSTGEALVSGVTFNAVLSVGSSIGQAIVSGVAATIPLFTAGNSTGSAIVSGRGNIIPPSIPIPFIEDELTILLPPIELPLST